MPLANQATLTLLLVGFMYWFNSVAGNDAALSVTHSLRGAETSLDMNGPSTCQADPYEYDYRTTLHELSEDRFIGSASCKGDIPSQASDIALTIAFTTDLHGHVKSLPRISTLVKDYRKQGHTLFLDSGDISIGTLFAKVHGAQGMSELMNFMGYQAIALGNHDLEYATQLHSNFPVISVNIPGFTNSTTIQVQGVKIGILAYTITENTTDALADLLRTIKVEAHCLRKSGAELVILLGHGVASMDKYIASETTGFIDAILGGHTHALLGCTKAYHNGSVIMNTGAAGEFLGVLKVNRTAGKTSYYSDLIPIETNIPEDPVLKAYLAPLLAALPTRNRLIATLSTPGTAVDQASSCRRGVCVTGEVIGAAVRWFHDCSVIALFEAGSIRDVFRTNISEFDLISTLPWENKIVLYSTSGRNVLDMLQHGARSVAHTGEAYLHTAGILYDVHAHSCYVESSTVADNTEHQRNNKETSIDHSREEDGSAIHDHYPSRDACKLHSKRRVQLGTSTHKLVPSAIYTIAVTDWLAGGGDGYGAYLAHATRLPDTKHSAVFVREMVEQYLAAAPPIAVQENSTSSSGEQADPQLRWQLHSLPHSTLLNNEHNDSLKAENATKRRAVVDHSSIWVGMTQCFHLWSGSAGMRSLIAILAEVPATLISHPLRTISTRQQSKTHSASYVGLWNGALLTIVAVMASKTVFWLVYYFALEQLSVVSGVTPSAVHQGLLGFCASLLAGVCECVIVHPLWVVVIRIQVFGYNKVKDLYGNICDGLGFSLLLVLFPCIRQFMFEYFMYIYDDILELRTAPFVNGAIGTVATITATVLSYPIQTLRTQSQTRSYEGIFSIKLFNGLGAKILSAAVQAFCFFFCKKLLEIFLLGK